MKRKQNGSFVSELAIFIIFLIGVFSIMVNHMIALSYKGQLDRLAYSASTIVAERKQLFNSEISISNKGQEIGPTLHKLIASSMKKMNKNFDKNKLSIRVEMIELEGSSSHSSNVSFNFHSHSIYFPSAKRRNFPDDFNLSKDDALKLLPMTIRDRYLPLYRVSLSYQIPFDLLGTLNGQSHRIISSSFSFGRIWYEKSRK